MRSRRSLTNRANGGFVLVTVIWSAGLIALLALSFMMGARTRQLATSNLVEAARAEALAEAAVNIAIAGLLQIDKAPAPKWLTRDGAPYFCSLPGNAVAAISVEHERGKIDLNSPSVLVSKLLAAQGFDPRRAEIAIRAARIRSGTPFQSIYEFDRAHADGAEVIRLLRPFVTAHSSTGLDLGVTHPAILAAVMNQPTETIRRLIAKPFPNPYTRAPVTEAAPISPIMLFRAEVITARGARFSREALVALQNLSIVGLPSILEWRQGQHRYAEDLLEFSRQTIRPSC